MSCFQSIEDRKTMLWATISNHYFYFQILWQTLVSNISKPNINNVMSYIPDKYFSCMHGKWGFVMHKGEFAMHAWQKRVCQIVCHACMAKLVLSEGVSFMHGQGFAIACTHDNGGFAMHAWQRRVCYTCMVTEGLPCMHGMEGLSCMHDKKGW